MIESTTPHIETVAVSAGRPAGKGAPLTPPLTLNSTYRAGGEGTSYGRVGNSTWSAFEDAMGALEGGHALAFASGIAAFAAIVETLPVGSAVVVPRSAYTSTRLLLSDLQTRGRVEAREVDITDTAATIDALTDASLLWIETPTNPLLEIADIRALAAAARERSVLSAVDNTFATPVLQRPLELGADVVMHSATKYVGGHSDLLLGVAVTRDAALRDTLHQRRTLHGGIPGAMESWLALRGLRTLPLRMERAQSNAQALAARLQEHAGVQRVRYPGLTDDPGYALAAAQMLGPGAMLSFELADADAADAVTARLALVVDATSLGGVETTIDRRHKWPGDEHVPPGLLRLSVGIEHIDDLWADITQALGG
ncbi:MAG: PLP-dependent aspartate aminotransferase family protein [Mycobacteriales bacterium]